MRKRFYQAGRIAAGLLVVVFAMTGAAKLADQVVTWLTFAVWQPFTIADALRFWSIPAPHAPKIPGLHQIAEAVLSWPGIPAYLLLAALTQAVEHFRRAALPIFKHGEPQLQLHGALQVRDEPGEEVDLDPRERMLAQDRDHGRNRPLDQKIGADQRIKPLWAVPFVEEIGAPPSARREEHLRPHHLADRHDAALLPHGVAARPMLDEALGVLRIDARHDGMQRMSRGVVAAELGGARLDHIGEAVEGTRPRAPIERRVVDRFDRVVDCVFVGVPSHL
jgi:hypothetical protein